MMLDWIMTGGYGRLNRESGDNVGHLNLPKRQRTIDWKTPPLHARSCLVAIGDVSTEAG